MYQEFPCSCCGGRVFVGDSESIHDEDRHFCDTKCSKDYDAGKRPTQIFDRTLCVIECPRNSRPKYLKATSLDVFIAGGDESDAVVQPEPLFGPSNGALDPIEFISRLKSIALQELHK